MGKIAVQGQAISQNLESLWLLTEDPESHAAAYMMGVEFSQSQATCACIWLATGAGLLRLNHLLLWVLGRLCLKTTDLVPQERPSNLKLVCESHSLVNLECLLINHPGMFF